MAIAAAIRSVPDVIAQQVADPIDETAERLVRGEIGGWFQGGSELGPRALGSRSIVCSPCGRRTKRLLNARVKYREAFRPFAPSVLAEHATAWFDFGNTTPDSPFMLRVVPFRVEARERVPAVVHVDGTGRLQTLTPTDHGRFYDLVARFHEKTGVPMLLNTSLNVQGEPIVESPPDALWCLLGTGLDFCVIGDWIVTKQPGFRSILDYVPAVVAKEYSLRLDVVDSALLRSIRREDGVTVRALSPWGMVDQVLPLRLLPLLTSIDGRKDGRRLLRSLRKSHSAATLVRDLLLLRRMHIVELRSRHVPLN
jgi:carbamoyltransferase